MSESRPVSEIAAEIGAQVVKSADHLKQFAPDLTASFPFELDDDSYTITITRWRKL